MFLGDMKNYKGDTELAKIVRALSADGSVLCSAIDSTDIANEIFDEMTDFAKHMDELKDLTIAINKNLGVFYESFDHEIEVYISPWVAKGFEDDALKKIAHHCFISNVRTLDGMNNVVNKL